MTTKTKIIIAVVAVIVIAGIAYWYYRSQNPKVTTPVAKSPGVNTATMVVDANKAVETSKAVEQKK